MGRRQAITEVKSTDFRRGHVERPVDKGVNSGWAPSSDGLKFGAMGEGTMLNEEFFLNLVGRCLQKYFKGEYDSFIGAVPLQRAKQAEVRREE